MCSFQDDDFWNENFQPLQFEQLLGSGTNFDYPDSPSNFLNDLELPPTPSITPPPQNPPQPPYQQNNPQIPSQNNEKSYFPSQEGNQPKSTSRQQPFQNLQIPSTTQPPSNIQKPVQINDNQLFDGNNQSIYHTDHSLALANEQVASSDPLHEITMNSSSISSRRKLNHIPQSPTVGTSVMTQNFPQNIPPQNNKHHSGANPNYTNLQNANPNENSLLYPNQVNNNNFGGGYQQRTNQIGTNHPQNQPINIQNQPQNLQSVNPSPNLFNSIQNKMNSATNQFSNQNTTHQMLATSNSNNLISGVPNLQNNLNQLNLLGNQNSNQNNFTNLNFNQNSQNQPSQMMNSTGMNPSVNLMSSNQPGNHLIHSQPQIISQNSIISNGNNLIQQNQPNPTGNHQMVNNGNYMNQKQNQMPQNTNYGMLNSNANVSQNAMLQNPQNFQQIQQSNIHGNPMNHPANSQNNLIPADFPPNFSGNNVQIHKASGPLNNNQVASIPSNQYQQNQRYSNVPVNNSSGNHVNNQISSQSNINNALPPSPSNLIQQNQSSIAPTSTNNHYHPYSFSSNPSRTVNRVTPLMNKHPQPQPQSQPIPINNPPQPQPQSSNLIVPNQLPLSSSPSSTSTMNYMPNNTVPQQNPQIIQANLSNNAPLTASQASHNLPPQPNSSILQKNSNLHSTSTPNIYLNGAGNPNGYPIPPTTPTSSVSLPSPVPTTRSSFYLPNNTSPPLNSSNSIDALKSLENLQNTIQQVHSQQPLQSTTFQSTNSTVPKVPHHYTTHPITTPSYHQNQQSSCLISHNYQTCYSRAQSSFLHENATLAENVTARFQSQIAPVYQSPFFNQNYADPGVGSSSTSLDNNTPISFNIPSVNFKMANANVAN